MSRLASRRRTLLAGRRRAGTRGGPSVRSGPAPGPARGQLRPPGPPAAPSPMLGQRVLGVPPVRTLREPHPRPARTRAPPSGEHRVARVSPKPVSRAPALQAPRPPQPSEAPAPHPAACGPSSRGARGAGARGSRAGPRGRFPRGSGVVKVPPSGEQMEGAAVAGRSARARAVPSGRVVSGRGRWKVDHDREGAAGRPGPGPPLPLLGEQPRGLGTFAGHRWGPRPQPEPPQPPGSPRQRRPGG